MNVLDSGGWGTVTSFDSPVTYVYRYDRAYNPVRTYSKTVNTRLRRKVRSAVTNNPFIYGWRYPAAYSGRVAHVVALAPCEYWLSPSSQWFEYHSLAAPMIDNLSVTAAANAPTFDRLRLSARNGALDKLNGERIQAGVALLEARKTIGHLAETSMRLIRLAFAMRRGNFGAAADLLGLNLSRKKRMNLAKNWLEYQYAWLPLLGDIKAAFDIAQQGIDVPLTVKAVRDVKDTVSPTFPRWEVQSYDSTRWQGVYNHKPLVCKCGVKSIIHARVDAAQLLRLKAFGLVNPASIAWELLPWSFVVDWFLPVGEFLSACSATFGLTFVSGTETAYLSVDQEIDAFCNSAIFTKSKPYSTAKLDVKVFSFERSVYLTFPRPVLHWAPHLTSNRLASAVALWHGYKRKG